MPRVCLTQKEFTSPGPLSLQAERRKGRAYLLFSLGKKKNKKCIYIYIYIRVCVYNVYIYISLYKNV